MQSSSLNETCLFFISLIDNIADIERPDEIFLSTFVLDNISGLFLQPSIFLLKSQKELKHYKNIYLYILFYAIEVFFCSKQEKTIQIIKTTIMF